MNGIHEVTGSTPVWSTSLRPMTRAIGCILLLSIAACRSGAPLSSSNPVSSTLPGDGVRVTGVVHHFNLEGSFWAVRGDDGKTYDPKDGLPAAFQVENLRVTMVVRIRTDLGGIHMVGPIVEILSIDRN
jgi:hypothetical protein